MNNTKDDFVVPHINQPNQVHITPILYFLLLLVTILNCKVVLANPINPEQPVENLSQFSGIDPEQQWVNIQKLTSSDELDGNAFGHAIAINGSRVLIGDIKDDADDNLSGAVFYYEFDGVNWVQRQRFVAGDTTASDRFGFSISMHGNLAVIGAIFVAETPFLEIGSAYIFEFNGTEWQERSRLDGSDTGTLDKFGTAVAISDEFVFVASTRQYSSGGAVYVFEFDGINWQEVQILQAGDAQANYKFGSSLYIENGQLIVGAIGAVTLGVDGGATYVFEHNGTQWVENQKITPNDLSDNQGFGSSVHLKGERLVIGADADSSSGQFFKGSAYVFEWNGGNWVEQQKLSASDGSTFNFFGSTVSQSDDLLMIAADKTNSGCISGSLYQFENNGGNWVETSQLIRNVPDICDLYASAFVLQDQQVLVGAKDEESTPGSVLYFDGQELIFTSGFE